MKKIILSIVLVLIVVLGVWLTLNKEKQNVLNDKLLLGQWSAYLDCPNDIFTFSENNKLNLRSCGGEEYGETENRTGVYKIIDEKIVGSIDKDTYEFTMEYVSNEPKLKLTNKTGSFLFFKVDTSNNVTSSTQITQVKTDTDHNNIGSSTIDGVNYDIDIPKNFKKSTETDHSWIAEGSSTYHPTSISIYVLDGIKDKNDLIKKEKKSHSYEGKAGYGNYSEMSNGVWGVDVSEEAKRIMNSHGFLLLADSVQSAEGEVGSQTFFVYVQVTNFPGKVFVLAYSVSLESVLSEYIMQKATFYRILENLSAYTERE